MELKAGYYWCSDDDGQTWYIAYNAGLEWFFYGSECTCGNSDVTAPKIYKLILTNRKLR